MTWGATPEDWAHFDLSCGLTADLLPVVSNPEAKISGDSRMKGLGKTPSAYNQRREVAGLKDWTERQTTARQVEKWSQEGDYGICIQTREVRGLDIDVPDPGLSAAVARRFLDALGLGRELPVRRRADTGKQLLGFRLPGDFRKRSFRVVDGLVELLANGQQFIAVGHHPSGNRYEWVGGLPADFPEISADDFERGWAAIAAEFALPDTERRSVRRDGDGQDGAVADPTAEWLEANWETYGYQGGKLFVACPWKDGHSSDSGETEAAWLMAGTTGYAQGHFACLHASCTGRTDKEFFAAVGKKPADKADFSPVGQPVTRPEASVADPVALYLAAAGSLPSGAPEPSPKVKATAAHPEMTAGLPLPGFVRTKSGEVEAFLPNVVKALAAPHACGVELRYDTFRGELMIAEEPEQWRSFEDADAVDLRIHLESIRFKPVGKELMRDALVSIARAQQFDSAVHWLETVVPAWDGVERIASFYPRHFKTKDTAYTRAVGAYVWTAQAGRVLSPGCQADMVPVLIGEEGLRKSSGVRAMAPADEFFVKLDLDVRDDDLSRKMRGKLVAELDELKGLAGRSGEAIKSWITLPFDEWTPKYVERVQRFWRRLVFTGTGNDREFMGANTGQRRWLPMEVLGVVDVDGIVADRLQLWAEGRERWRAGGVAFVEAEELARDEHANFTDTDAWLSVVGRWLDEPDLKGRTPRKLGGLRSEDVLLSACGIDAGRVRKADQMRVAAVLKELGMVRGQRWIGGRNVKTWEDENADLG